MFKKIVGWVVGEVFVVRTMNNLCCFCNGLITETADDCCSCVGKAVFHDDWLNLTPHSITVGEREFPPSGLIARVSTTEEVVGKVQVFESCFVCDMTGGYCGDCGAHQWTGVGEVPVVRRVMGKVEGLPAPVGNLRFIVSSMVLDNCEGREDVFSPDTGETAIRDEKGRVVRATRLIACKQ